MASLWVPKFGPISQNWFAEGRTPRPSPKFGDLFPKIGLPKAGPLGPTPKFDLLGLILGQLGPLWDLLGPLWGLLGPLWGLFRGILGASMGGNPGAHQTDRVQDHAHCGAWCADNAFHSPDSEGV